MLSRKLLMAGATGPLPIWKDLFTEASDKVIHQHTPDIGSGYHATKSIGGLNVNAAAPDVRVSGVNDRAEHNGLNGALFNTLLGTGAYTVNFVAGVGASAIIYHLRIPASPLTAGVRYSHSLAIAATGMVLRDTTQTIGSYTGTITAGDLITIEDANTNTIGAIVVKINGVTRLTNTIAASNAGNTYHGFYFAASGLWLDALEITQ